MIKRLRFEKTNSNDYVVMSAGDSKLTLAVIRPENGKWLALLPHNNGSVSVNDVSMAVFAVGSWDFAMSTVMRHLLIEKHS